jgi:hypothetical protein
MLFKWVLSGVVVGGHVWVSFVVIYVLFELELRVVAMGCQVWVSLVVSGRLVKGVC